MRLSAHGHGRGCDLYRAAISSASQLFRELSIRQSPHHDEGPVHQRRVLQLVGFLESAGRFPERLHLIHAFARRWSAGLALAPEISGSTPKAAAVRAAHSKSGSSANPTACCDGSSSGPPWMETNKGWAATTVLLRRHNPTACTGLDTGGTRILYATYQFGHLSVGQTLLHQLEQTMLAPHSLKLMSAAIPR